MNRRVRDIKLRQAQRAAEKLWGDLIGRKGWEDVMRPLQAGGKDGQYKQRWAHFIADGMDPVILAAQEEESKRFTWTIYGHLTASEHQAVDVFMSRLSGQYNGDEAQAWIITKQPDGRFLVNQPGWNYGWLGTWGEMEQSMEEFYENKQTPRRLPSTEIVEDFRNTE